MAASGWAGVSVISVRCGTPFAFGNRGWRGRESQLRHGKGAERSQMAACW